MTIPAETHPNAALKSATPRFWIATPRSIIALILREMSTSYGRSPGGYLWAVLEPTAGIALLTIVFSMGFQAPALGTNFPLFYATGMLPFLAYMDVQAKLATALMFSKALLSYPRVTYVDALLARFCLNFFTQLLVSYLIFAAISLTWDTKTALDLPRIATSLAMVGMLSFGVGTLNCFLSMRFQVWQRIWAILNRPLFLVSCIFFLFDAIPEPWRGVLWYNPLVHVVGMMRAGFYPYYDASYVSVPYVMGLGLGLTALGLLLLDRHHRDLLQR
ncbi:ABC transporter permease [Actibacterium ureilyticum]|uniref:ABC transporter permease n=1 Tax=Actibacterium ureilyticum TaxID=1590614 RepID=UPI000BAA9A3F|nr:ABC transporter permease [Actibacterium ureilyticum]